jgi:serine/threonine protein kinase
MTKDTSTGTSSSTTSWYHLRDLSALDSRPSPSLLKNVSQADGSKIKLIDFGFMVALPASGVLKTPGNLVGTEGWFAPESILDFEYSIKTDIWQAGCILYTMLAGHPPFHSNPKYRYQITRLTYSPMKGPAWDTISAEAKDLVDKMLTKDPLQRITIEEILSHPWLQSPASETELGEEYNKRIKSLSLRQKLKRAFLAHNLHDHLTLRESFQDALPFLKPPTESENSIAQDNDLAEEFNSRLLKLKEILVSAIFDSSELQEDSETDEQAVRGLVNKRRKLSHHGEIDYLAFCSLVETANLQVLAAPEIFAIFDTDGSGTIDMKEFLLTLLALKPSDNETEELEAAKLYFSVFDVDEDGFIGESELELVVGCLLHDGAGPLLVTSDHDVNAPNIEEMFQLIDTNHDGRIDFEEFREFYNAVLLPSSRQSSLSLTQSATQLELGFTMSQVYDQLNDSPDDDI